MNETSRPDHHDAGPELSRCERQPLILIIFIMIHDNDA
jgi:hypothetical protein